MLDEVDSLDIRRINMILLSYDIKKSGHI